MKGLYAVPLGVPFLPTLVEKLISQTQADSLSLARYLVILSTRRGCLMLQEAFLRAAPSGFRILPRIMSLADIEEGADIEGYMPPEIYPPAMPTLQRLGLLSQLVLAFEKKKDGGIQSPAAAMKLAQELMRLVDEVETTGLQLRDLKTLVGADYAAHWQLTLDFLKILTDLWPPILEQAGFLEPAARKRLVLEQLATNWKPNYPVVLAGTTATRPATALLAKHILNMEMGSVVLAGVDESQIPQSKSSLPPTHPQFTLAQLIQDLGKPLIWLGKSDKNSVRSRFLSKAMEATPNDDWRISEDMATDVLTSVQAIEASSIQEEARQIALIMRYEMETPGQTIALVTPDGELTRRVQSALQRWGLHANLSSGLAFTQSVVGRFLGLSSLLTQDMGAADLLALLKHPLYAKGRDRLSHLKAVRRFEIDFLRGGQSLDVKSLPFPGHELCAPLLALNNGQSHSFEDFLKAHKVVAQALVGTNEEDTQDQSLLWGEEDGQVALTFWEELLKHAASFSVIKGQDYPYILRQLCAQEVVRDVEGIGSRIRILGALEARLLQADVLILGGLNEGIWPGIEEDDPWLSRSMRESFGLPPLERKIGLSAHDFCTGMTASKVYMTRSLKRDGSPTLPSRWWQRFRALLITGERDLNAIEPWAQWSRALDCPSEHLVFLPPAPCPPLSVRPQRLSVTEVERLLQDPYSIYAKKILKLYPLEPLDADLTQQERGQAIHKALEAFIRCGVDPASPEAMNKLEELGREAFGNLLLDPRAKAFWWPRFQRLSAWFITQMIHQKADISNSLTEIEGKTEFQTSNGPVVLTAKADRIDIMTSGQACIIDYKTGMVPTRMAVTMGQSPQLSLEGVILHKGGFSGAPATAVEKLAYWRVTGGAPPGEVVSFNSPEALILSAEQGVQNLFEAFLGSEIPFYACPDPLREPVYSDYTHLERLDEWK